MHRWTAMDILLVFTFALAVAGGALVLRESVRIDRDLKPAVYTVNQANEIQLPAPAP
jgi:hypothetical protein